MIADGNKEFLAIPFSDARSIGLLVFIATLAIGFIIRAILRRKKNANDVERIRRDRVFRIGKISDGEITEVDSTSITYHYSVAGVVYLATQDLTFFASQLPLEAGSIGPVSIRFDPRNPANSIVLCEQWSGLRAAPVSSKTTPVGKSG